ncbi:MAG: hypothetical protein ACHQF2_05560 [Flavobacteriales bacterium]
MASFFKKALGLFVEFEENDQNKGSETNSHSSVPAEVLRNPANQAEAEKFEKYFDKLFEDSNLPGPDYFEFYKMMETLETHIQDEKARFSATFASLSIQGLTKKKLIDTATQYKIIIEKDKADFDRALSEKLKAEVGQRQHEIEELQKRNTHNSELIQKLTKEITESQVLIEKLKNEVVESEGKLTKNSHGYQVASQAILNKITTDIDKIQSTL